MTSIPAAESSAHPEFDRLVDVVAVLRGPGGCPWDAEQTHESLVKYLIEESYELVDAIENGTPDDVQEELGDVLYQVLFHSDLLRVSAGVGIDDVARRAADKMVGRHPHVFAGQQVADTAEVVRNWEQLKAAEKSDRTSVLDGIPPALPALALADKVIGRAERVGVVVVGAAAEDDGALADESALGDALLALVAGARASGLDAERALRSAVAGLSDGVRAAEAG